MLLVSFRSGEAHPLTLSKLLCSRAGLRTGRSSRSWCQKGTPVKLEWQRIFSARAVRVFPSCLTLRVSAPSEQRKCRRGTECAQLSSSKPGANPHGACVGAAEHGSPESQQSSALRAGVTTRFMKHTSDVHAPRFRPHVKLLQPAVSAQSTAHSRAERTFRTPGCRSPPTYTAPTS